MLFTCCTYFGSESVLAVCPSFSTVGRVGVTALVASTLTGVVGAVVDNNPVDMLLVLLLTTLLLLPMLLSSFPMAAAEMG